MTYSTFETKYLYDGPIFSVVKQTVVNSDAPDKPFVRDVVRHRDAVAVVALRHVGEGDQSLIALIRQYRHPLGEYTYELPAGLMDAAGEEAEDVGRRELIEETGFEASHMDHLCTIASSPGFTDERVHIYLATHLNEVGRPEAFDEEADLELKWVPLPWAVTNIFRGQIISAHTVAGILAAKEWLA